MYWFGLQTASGSRSEFTTFPPQQQSLDIHSHHVSCSSKDTQIQEESSLGATTGGCGCLLSSRNSALVYSLLAIPGVVVVVVVIGIVVGIVVTLDGSELTVETFVLNSFESNQNHSSHELYSLRCMITLFLVHDSLLMIHDSLFFSLNSDDFGHSSSRPCQCSSQ